MNMRIIKKLVFFILFLSYLIILFELLLTLAPPILSFIREPRLFFKKTQDFKIYALGDSFTYGLGLEKEEAYPARFEQYLKDSEKENLRGIQVINLGKPAHSLSTFYYQIKELNETTKLKNSLIILQGGWNCNDNDFIRFKKQQSKDFFTHLKLFLNNLRTFRIIKSYYLYKKIYYPYGSEDYIPPFMGMMHYNFDAYQKITLQYLTKIARYAQENNIKIILLNYPQTPPPENKKTDLEFYHYLFGHKKLSQEDYLIKESKTQEIAINRIIRYISQKYELPLIDINKSFQEAKTSQELEEKDLFLDDHHHPNSKGAEIMSKEIYKKFLEMESFLSI